ncbi:sialidase [Parascardovia denticolens]|nr:sialidase [Parascardovia denticolens]
MMNDTMPSTAPDVMPTDIPSEISADTPVDSSVDTSAGTSPDTSVDASPDASVDAPMDASADSSMSAPLDAPLGARVDESAAAQAKERREKWERIGNRAGAILFVVTINVIQLILIAIFVFFLAGGGDERLVSLYTLFNCDPDLFSSTFETVLWIILVVCVIGFVRMMFVQIKQIIKASQAKSAARDAQEGGRNA